MKLRIILAGAILATLPAYVLACIFIFGDCNDLEKERATTQTAERTTEQ